MKAESDSATDTLGECLFTEEMILQPNGGSIRITVPQVAVRFFEYDVGEERKVEVYEDGVFIPAEAPDE